MDSLPDRPRATLAKQALERLGKRGILTPTRALERDIVVSQLGAGLEHRFLGAPPLLRCGC